MNQVGPHPPPLPQPPPAPPLALSRVSGFAADDKAVVPFLSDYFSPRTPAHRAAAAHALAFTLQQAGYRWALVYLENQRPKDSRVIPPSLESRDTASIIWARFLRVASVPFPASFPHRKPYDLIESAREYTSLCDTTNFYAFSTLVSALLNTRGALATSCWPDPIGGPNAHAAAIFLAHCASDSPKELNLIVEHFEQALILASKTGALSGLAAVLAAIEPLLLLPPNNALPALDVENHETRAHWESQVFFSNKISVALTKALNNAITIFFDASSRATTRNSNSTKSTNAAVLASLTQVAPAAANTPTPAVSADTALATALAFAGVLSRIAVLVPSVLLSVFAGIEGENGYVARIRLQMFLNRVIGEDAGVRPPAWQWHAARSPRCSRVEADVSVSIGAPGVARAADVAGIALRRHLIRVIAGPVPEISALTEGYAVALAAPERSVLAHIYRARFERALLAVGLPFLAEPAHFEAVFLQQVENQPSLAAEEQAVDDDRFDNDVEDEDDEDEDEEDDLVD
jgi:hypothetical protein